MKSPEVMFDIGLGILAGLVTAVVIGAWAFAPLVMCWLDRRRDR